VAAPLDALLQEGVAAVQAGQSERGRACLLRVVAADERNVQAWYWLSRVAESAQEREICLENILVLDPGHTAVQAELASLRRQLAHAGAASLPAREAIGVNIPRTPLEQRISDAALEPLLCPYCGADTDAVDRQCGACGRDLYLRQPKSEDHSIYSLGLVIAWFALANHVWLALTAYYIFSGLSSAAEASSGTRRTLATLGQLLGLEGGETPLLDLPLAPVLLLGAAVFVLSLVIAWGLYRRIRFFYWLTVALVVLYPLVVVYQLATAETVPILGLAVEGFFFLLTISFTFMAYDEFAWVEQRLDAGVDRDVDSHSALYTRGREHADRGMWAKAAAHWARAVVLNPGHPDYRTALALAYINLDRRQQALEHLDEARRIEPDNPQVHQLLDSLQT
jgi:tetratricopeptide (TPR) repeat protein